MCGCDFDMKFTFVYTGWEVTANDSRVFLDALRRLENNFPWPASGKIYCCLTFIFTFFKFNPFIVSYFSLSSLYLCTVLRDTIYETFKVRIVLKVLKSYSIIDIRLFVM